MAIELACFWVFQPHGAMPGSVRRPGSRFLLRHEAAAIIIELRPEHGVLLPETGNILLQQVDVLAIDEQQGNTDDRDGRQYSQRQAKAEDGLMSKTRHCISLL